MITISIVDRTGYLGSIYERNSKICFEMSSKSKKSKGDKDDEKEKPRPYLPEWEKEPWTQDGETQFPRFGHPGPPGHQDHRPACNLYAVAITPYCMPYCTISMITASFIIARILAQLFPKEEEEENCQNVGGRVREKWDCDTGGNHSIGPQPIIQGSQAQFNAEQATDKANKHKMHTKMEDALDYLDQVKCKFSDQPQVYNDFLDVMKEFKFKSISTPGAIRRVSHLFRDHPDLIVGFNAFLPTGYKIEVQSNEQGYAFQVSVSMPIEGTAHTSTITQRHCTVNVRSPSISSPPIQIMQRSGSIHNGQAQAVSQALRQAQESQPVEFTHAVNYVNKIKNRFQNQPDKYKKFLEILHTYQKQDVARHMNIGSENSVTESRRLTEADVYSQVAKILENQEDLLLEFEQFLPDTTNLQSTLTNKLEPVNDDSTITKKSLRRKTPYNNYGTLPRDHRDSG